MAQLIPIVSEALQSTVRRLLPSQSGFGEDLQAQNVIVPIIDLTASAEGSVLNQDLQEALNFGGATVLNVGSGGTQVAANTPGFYRMTINVLLDPTSGTSANGYVEMSDGLSTKKLLDFHNLGGTDVNINIPVDKVFYLTSGETLSIVSATLCTIRGSIRQIATNQGVLVNPVGFVAE